MSKSVELRLKDYPRIKAELKKWELVKETISQEVIHESQGQWVLNPKTLEYEPMTYVTSSTISNPTLNKVIRIDEKTEQANNMIKIYSLELRIIENALTVLTEWEKTTIEKLFFQNKNMRAACEEMEIGYDTINRYKRTALSKLRPLFNIEE